MLKDIHDISKPVGLNMHLGKTKVMCNKQVNKDNVIVDWRKIEEVDRYIYLRQMVSKDHYQVQEMKSGIGQGWSAFCKLDNIMRDKNVLMRLKRKAFNQCILQVMTYGCETWSLSNTQLEKLVTMQKEDGKNHGRSHPQGQKAYKLDPETEWCDRRYQDHKRKQTQMGRATWRGDGTTDGLSESQNRYPVDIKDLEAN